MYVCICNGYRDAEIREVAESGVQCAREAYCTLGGGPICGKCLDFAQTLIDEHCGRQTTAPARALKLETVG